MRLFAQRLSGHRIGLAVVLAACVLMVPFAARAEEDTAAIERVTNLNKKALDAYNSLDFEDARKLLKQALDLCGSAGLDRHPIKARTHVHMGVVLIAAKQQELGIKQFRKALEIQPDIQVTKALANPEILQAFAEAGAGGGGSGGDSGGGDSGGGPAASGEGRPPQADISHYPVSRGKKGRPISIAATVSSSLTGYAKVVLAYRAEGTEDYLARDMRRSGTNRFVAEIPGDATEGNVVQYYIEAEAEDESPVASAGSEEKPFSVSLSGKGGGGRGDGDDDGDDDDDGGGQFYISVLGGLGTGYATGNGEVNVRNKVNPGFAPSSAAQIVPEVGYFFTEDFRLTLQLRYQIVSGPTPLHLDQLKIAFPNVDDTECGSDKVCSTATYAFAAIVRGSWFFGSDTFRPYFSLAVGAGQIRHVVKFTSLTVNKKGFCGKTGMEICVDTVLAGPVFAGPGGGLLVNITPNFALVLDVGTLLGFPKFTFHVDGNIGVAAKF